MMRADVHPGNQVFLCDILPIEEMMKIDQWSTWQISVPHAAGCRLSFLAKRHSQIISRPVGIVQESF